MSPFLDSFLPVAFLGVLFATTVSVIAGRLARIGWTLVLIGLGTLALWAALFFGADLGYRAWQSIPDAPERAFRDTSVVGLMFIGWLPAGAFCLSVFGLTVGMRRLLHWANPDVYPLHTNPKK